MNALSGVSRSPMLNRTKNLNEAAAYCAIRLVNLIYSYSKDAQSQDKIQDPILWERHSVKP